MKYSENYLTESKNGLANPCENGSPNATDITPIRAIAIILAYGVLRLQQRQKDLDSRTEQSVHDPVLVTKGETS